ncbi:MAG: alanine racemase [Candidatus Saccharimonadales bacterium]
MQLHSVLVDKLRFFEKKFTVFNNIYISKSAILDNFDLLHKLMPAGFVIPVLKSNAYGHGLEQVSTILKERNFPYTAVDGYYEGLRIHLVSKQPVIVMGSISHDNYAKINPKGFAFVVHDIPTVKAIGKSGKKFVVHIELETGMGRHGVRINELDEFLATIGQYKNIHVEGVMTHLADSDNPETDEFVKLQTSRFDNSIETIKKAGFKPKYFHIAQSAGSVKTVSKYANTLRVGIALYGITSLENTDKYASKLSDLRPALALTSTITKVLKIDKGESVSYSRTFIAKRDSDIGVLPLGYYEGIPRALSNAGQVKLGDKYFTIAGRVCMNHTMIDVTKSPVKVGDKVTIISGRPNDKLSVNQICNKHNLFNYSFLVGLNENIRRTIID